MMGYPVFLNLVDRPVLVVGSGTVGRRKMRGLIEAKARVRVVTLDPTPGDEFAGVAWRTGAYEVGDLDDRPLLVFAAANPQVNRQVGDDCRTQGILFHSADDPAGADFVSPAFGRRGPIQVAVSADPPTPMITRRVREELLESIDTATIEWCRIVGEWRRRILGSDLPEWERKRLLERLSDDEWRGRIRSEGAASVEEAVRSLVSSATGR